MKKQVKLPAVDVESNPIGLDSNLLVLEYKKVLHRHLYYASNELAKLVLEFKGRPSLTIKELTLLKQMGFKIELKQKFEPAPII